MPDSATELPEWLIDKSRSRRAVVMAGSGVSADLPRQAEVIAVTALFHAEFAQDLYPGFLNQQAEPVLAQAKRLNAPTIDGFIALAHGRYLTKTFAGAVAHTHFARP